MIELKKYEGGSSFEAEEYRNGELTNSLHAIWERKTETEKKVFIILHYGRIIVKGPNPEVIRDHFISKNLIDESDKNTPIDEIKFLIKEKLEKHNDEILEDMRENFKVKSWFILLGHTQNAPIKALLEEYINSQSKKQAKL